MSSTLLNTTGKQPLIAAASNTHPHQHKLSDCYLSFNIYKYNCVIRFINPTAYIFCTGPLNLRPYPFFLLIHIFLCPQYCFVFHGFRTHVHERVNRAERQFGFLPDHHQQLLTNFIPNLNKIRYCVDRNQEMMQAIVHNCLHMFENMEYGQDVGGSQWL